MIKEGIKKQQVINISKVFNAKSITPYLQMNGDHHAKIVKKMKISH